MALAAAGLFWLAACTHGFGSAAEPSPAASLTTSSGQPDIRLLQPRAVHHATALADGRVLVTGGCTQPGCGGFDAARASEIFDPSVEEYLPGPTMLEPRASAYSTAAFC